MGGRYIFHLKLKSTPLYPVPKKQMLQPTRTVPVFFFAPSPPSSPPPPTPFLTIPSHPILAWRTLCAPAPFSWCVCGEKKQGKKRKTWGWLMTKRTLPLRAAGFNPQRNAQCRGIVFWGFGHGRKSARGVCSLPVGRGWMENGTEGVSFPIVGAADFCRATYPRPLGPLGILSSGRRGVEGGRKGGGVFRLRNHQMPACIQHTPARLPVSFPSNNNFFNRHKDALSCLRHYYLAGSCRIRVWRPARLPFFLSMNGVTILAHSAWLRLEDRSRTVDGYRVFIKYSSKGKGGFLIWR